MTLPNEAAPRTKIGHPLRGALAIATIAIVSVATTPSDAAQGITPNEIIVGTHVDLSGPLAAWGTAVRDGIEMAFDEANEAGGVNGRTLRLVTRDDGYDAERARQAVRELVEIDRAFAILSPLGTPTTQAAAGEALERDILYLFPLTAAPQISAQPTPTLQSQYMFSLTQSSEDEIAMGLRRVLETRPGAKIAVFSPDDDFGHSVRSGAKAQLASMDIELTADVITARGAGDYSIALSWLRERDVNVIVLAPIAEEAITILQAARTMRWRPTFICPSSCYTPELAALGGEVVEGLFAIGKIPIPYTSDRLLGDWAQSYESKFGSIASTQALTAYRNAKLFLNVLDRVGRTPTQPNFRHALETLGPWTDPLIDMPPIIFSAEDHNGLHDLFLAQARNGRWIIVPQVSPTRL